MASEEELWSSIPTVFQGYITMIFYDAVWIRRDNNNGVLQTKKSISKYILVYTCIYHDYSSIQNDII